MTIDELIAELHDMKKNGVPGYLNVVFEEEEGFGRFRFMKDVKIVHGKPVGEWTGRVDDLNRETDETIKCIGLR